MSVSPYQDGQVARHKSLEVDHMVRKASDAIRHMGKYELEIVSGVHEGAVTRLDQGKITLGSSKDNTIVLFGDEVAARHLELDLPGSVLKNIRVTPLEAAVKLEDGSVVEIGQFAEVNPGEHIYFGDAAIRMGRIGTPKLRKKTGMRLLAIVCLIAMIPLVYNLVSNTLIGVAGAGSRAISAIHTTLSRQKDAIIGASTINNAERLESFSWTIRTQLEDFKLNHKLRVAPLGTDSLQVSGNISDQEVGRWTAFLRWYDANPGFPPLVRDVKRVSVDSNLPQINSVWLDKEPTVVFRDGTVATVGSMVKDGWMVFSISNQDVVLEREGTKISLTF